MELLNTVPTVEVLPHVLRGSETPLAGRCASPLSKQPGRYCIGYPMVSKTRCRMHGGPSPSGLAHYNFKHGLFSKDLQGLGLGAAYQRARTNPDLINHVEHIAVLDARTSELFGRLHPAEALPSWDRVGAIDTAFHALREAQRTKDVAAMMASLTAMGTDIEALMAARGTAQHEVAVWDELKAVFLLRKKLVDSESRRRKDAMEMLDKSRVMGLLAKVAQSMRRHVTDPRALQAVIDDMRIAIAEPRATAGARA